MELPLAFKAQVALTLETAIIQQLGVIAGQ
jgi:hypothetical protein